MAIISSKKQPPEPNGEPKQRRESAKAPSTDNILQPEAAIDEQDKQEEGIRPQ
ncbi:MAG: Holliday junction branch migration DNA helicase RuvB, partial [Nostoc sp.]